MAEQFSAVGAPPEPSSGIPCVALARKVYRQLASPGVVTHTSSRVGLLVGMRQGTVGGTLIRVLEAVELSAALPEVGTAEAMAYLGDQIYEAALHYYPNFEPVGWYHTHPGFGVFVSNYDREIHAELSRLGFDISFIIDPVKNQSSFFYLSNGQMACCPGYYVFDSVDPEAASSLGSQGTGPDPLSVVSPGPGLWPAATPTTPPATRAVPSRAAQAGPFPRVYGRILAALLAVMCVAMFFGAFQLMSLSSIVNSLADRPPDLAFTMPLVPKPDSAPQPSAGLVSMRVLPGDSVHDLSRRLYGSTNAEIVQAILDLNGIEDPRGLPAWTTIRFPYPSPGGQVRNLDADDGFR